MGKEISQAAAVQIVNGFAKKSYVICSFDHMYDCMEMSIKVADYKIYWLFGLPINVKVE